VRLGQVVSGLQPGHYSSLPAHPILVHETATYRCDETRGCVMQFGPPDDELICLKHVMA